MRKVFAVGNQRWLGGLTPKLEEAHLSYRLAETPKKLASYLKVETPSIVLCDIMLPKLSGLEVVRQIRSKNIDIAVIMVKDPATFDFETLTLFEFKRGASKGESDQVAWPKLSLPTAPELHNPRSGRLDARKVADFFGMSPATFAKVLGKSPQALHKTPDAESLQERLAVFARIATSLLSALEGKAQVRIWLNSPNPDLDETRPIELLKNKRPEVVAELLEDALLGHPS